MHMLLQLARAQNKTVITSIHQPNSALFHSFDKLIMLAEGNVVYFGSPRNSLTYLRNCNLSCPDGYNAADHWMDLLVHDTAIDESTTRMASFASDELTMRTGNELDDTFRSGAGSIVLAEDRPTEMDGSSETNAETDQGVMIESFSMTTRERLIRAWDNGAIADLMDQATLDAVDEDTANTGMYGKYNTSWGMQYRVLVHRSLKNSRSAIFTPINLIKSAALGLVSGALWFQMDYTEATVFDMSSFFFFTMTYWVVRLCENRRK